MKEVYYENNLFYEFKELDNKDIKHIFTSRIGCKEDKLKEIFSVDKIIKLKQIHSSKVYIVDEEFLSSYTEEIEGDGLVTNLKDVLLVTYHADCLPLYFVDESKAVIGLAHSGWKGTYNNIACKLVYSMIKEFDSNPKDIKAYIGPGIGSCCYEVGEDLYKKFLLEYGQADGSFVKKDSSYYIGLAGIVEYQLSKILDRENIYNSGICTSCNVDKFYSYRREKGMTGRMFGAIAIK